MENNGKEQWGLKILATMGKPLCLFRYFSQFYQDARVQWDTKVSRFNKLTVRVQAGAYTEDRHKRDNILGATVRTKPLKLGNVVKSLGASECAKQWRFSVVAHAAYALSLP